MQSDTLFLQNVVVRKKQKMSSIKRLFQSDGKRSFSTNAHFRVALEWTPNPNHIGFYIARAKGYYSDSNLSIELISPHIDGYKQTPGSRAISGNAEFAMGPTETAISSATTESEKIKLISVAALLQKSTSCIVTLESSGIDNISNIRTCASYEGRFEMPIIHEMIRWNGGDPDKLIEVVPSKLNIWPSLMNNIVTEDGVRAESTWIFEQWEGVEAALNGINLNRFRLEDYGIPYGYSPILLCREDVLEKQMDAVKRFISATKRGYEYVKLENVDECTDILIRESGFEEIARQRDLVKKSLMYLIENDCYSNEEGEWGKMDKNVWNTFLDWICDKNIVTKRDGTIVKREELKIEDLMFMDGLCDSRC